MDIIERCVNDNAKLIIRLLDACSNFLFPSRRANNLKKPDLHDSRVRTAATLGSFKGPIVQKKNKSVCQNLTNQNQSEPKAANRRNVLKLKTENEKINKEIN